MQPYLLKAPLQRKDPEVRFETCQVDRVIELRESEFRFFMRNLMQEYDFLREYNNRCLGEFPEGVRCGVLVLGQGSDDGVFVCTEGYDYARYSAYIPNARQIMMLKDYPALQDYSVKMKRLADCCIEKAVTVGMTDTYKTSLDSLRGASLYDSFNTELFLEMVGSRPEVENVDVDGDDILLILDPEQLPKQDWEMRILTEEELKVACAKHLLWSFDAGGQQADFSNCIFENADFAGMELNSAVFDGAVFKHCDLSDASLCFASFRGCKFVDCSCRDWTAEEADFRDAVFDHCDMNGAVMTHSNFSGAVLQDCQTENASLQNSLITGMVLRDASSATLNMIGTTIDAEAWGSQEEQSLSQEELQ